MPSVEDFLGGATDAADDSGVDIMQNPKAFHDSEEESKKSPIATNFMGPIVEHNEVSPEQRRTYALELAINGTNHQGDLAALLENAEAINTFLRTGRVEPRPTPAAPPQDDGTGVETAQDAAQAPTTQDEDGPREGP